MKVKNLYLKILEYLHLSFNKWPYSVNSRYLLFFEKNTIMGNTADLTGPEDDHWDPPKIG